MGFIGTSGGLPSLPFAANCGGGGANCDISTWGFLASKGSGRRSGHADFQDVDVWALPLRMHQLMRHLPSMMETGLDLRAAGMRRAA